jgi:hypothetical protein
MRDHIENQGMVDRYKAMNGIIDYFADAMTHSLLSVLLKLSRQMYKARGDKKDLLV